MATATLRSMPRPRKAASSAGVCLGVSDDLLDQSTEALLDHGAHLRVVRRGVGLQLDGQVAPVADELDVGLAHPPEGVVPVGGTAASLSEALDRLVEGPLDGSHEELLLGAEEAEEVGLRTAHVRGDRLRRGPVQPGRAEAHDSRPQDLLPALLGRVSGVRRCSWRED